MIRIEHLTVGYGDRRLIDDASGDFPNGQLTALLGRNGAGKSTLLRALAGLSAPMAGGILYDGRDVLSLSPNDRAKTVALVTTERVRIPNLRCRDLVAMGRAPYTNWIGHLEPDDREIVMHSLEVVGMADYADRTMDQMSDGECQRVMIARALAQDTKTVLLDEPTSFLDLPNRYELCVLLAKLAHEEGKCIVFSTHELDIALSICDRIALIDSPHLHILPTDEMADSGHIQRLFSNSIVSYDPQTRQIVIRQQ